jgi:GNAT superfamily N-acetyltransferase
MQTRPSSGVDTLEGMEKVEVIVRRAARGDIRAAAAVLARAFEDDPGLAYVLPDPDSRRRRLRRYFGTMLRWEALPTGATDVALTGGQMVGGQATIVGVAVWKPPNRWLPQIGTQLLTLPGYLAGFRRGLSLAARTEGVMVKEHPRAEPHWYLQAIGAEPELQGSGVGAALLRSRLARVDEEGLAAYLESSKLANVPLYEHFGFEDIGLLGLPQGAPPITRMWRRAVGGPDPGPG